MSRNEPSPSPSPSSPSLLRRIAVVGAFLLILAPVAAIAENADTSESRQARGKVSYRIYCQNCHGSNAEGDGPIAELLVVKSSDLTRLAEENEGQFPSAEVYRVIDGRDSVRGHGSREMPIWGLTFQDPGRGSDQEIEVRERILDLVAFLRSIQK